MVDTAALDATRATATVEWRPSPETAIAASGEAAALVDRLANAATLYSAAQLSSVSVIA